MRNLANFLVHLFGRSGDQGHSYLSPLHDRCLLCEEPISESQAYLTYRVCPYCRFHYTLSARERVELLVDKGSFKESHKYLSSVAPLSFSRRGTYHKLLTQDQNRTGLTEAAVTGRCKIDGTEIVLVVLDFGFMGGSMGSVVGEKVATALETAARREVPLVALVTGGGTRVQEGVLSLMQMAKTVAAANRLLEKSVPFIVVLANPSTRAGLRQLRQPGRCDPRRAWFPHRPFSLANDAGSVQSSPAPRCPYGGGPPGPRSAR